MTVWGKFGESVAKYLVRGREVLVQGRLRQERWQGSDGKTLSRICVVSENMELLREQKGSRAEPPAAREMPPAEPAETPAPGNPFAPPEDSDNPFADAEPVF